MIRIDVLFSGGRLPRGMGASGRFDIFAGFDVARAYFDTMDRAVFIYDPDCLKIRFPAPLGNTGNILPDTAFTFRFTTSHHTIAYLRTLAAIFTYSGHSSFLAIVTLIPP